MKRSFTLFLLLSMALMLFAGCSEKEMTKAGNVSDFESQANIQVGISEDAAEDTSKAPLSGEFVVSEKKYDYNGANLMLLYVENQTNRHYNVTIHGTYFDENGETIQEETQTFEGFASGWSNHFVFYPRKAFDSFTYTVDTEEFIPETMHADESGTPYSAFAELTYPKTIQWTRGLLPSEGEHAEEIRVLDFQVTAISSHDTAEIGVEYQLLVLDDKGEIFITSFDQRDKYDQEYANAIGMGGAGWRSSCCHVGEEMGHSNIALKEQEIGGNETLPDAIKKGDFTVIFAVMSVYDHEEWIRPYLEAAGMI